MFKGTCAIMFSHVRRIRAWRFYSTHSDHERKAPNGLKYDDDQIDGILDVLNTASAQDMQTFKLSKENSRLLIDHRKKHGGFDSLQSLMQVEGISKENLIKLCKKINGTQNGYQLKKKMVIPEIWDSTIGTVTALTVCPFHLTMAHVWKNPLELCKWEQITFSEEQKPKPIHKILETALNAFGKLPQSDAYVIEQLPTKMKQKSGFSFMLNVAALQASLVTLLNSDHQQTNEYFFRHVVYTIKPQTITKHFKIGVGNERISCLDLMSLLIKREININSCLKDLTIPQHLVDHFNTQKPAHRHEFGTTLLMAIAFYDIQAIKSENKFGYLSI